MQSEGLSFQVAKLGGLEERIDAAVARICIRILGNPGKCVAKSFLFIAQGLGGEDARGRP